jgi:hypothetical protein
MSNLLTISKSFLEWAQSLPDVVIPAGLESDMQEAIAKSEAVEHSPAGQSDMCQSHTWNESHTGFRFCPDCGNPITRR